MEVPRIILLGPPASGKSTLFQNLLQVYPDIGHFAVRLFFEKEKKLNSNWNKRAIPDHNGWLPDEVVAEAAEQEILKVINRGFVVEGFPASTRQAELLVDILKRNKIEMDGIVYLKVISEISLQRSLNRWVCIMCDNGVNHVESLTEEFRICPKCGTLLTRRHDDEEEKFRKRLTLHHEKIINVVDIVNLPTIEIDASKSKQEVLEETLRFLSNGRG